jgi:hypothetical protein
MLCVRVRASTWYLCARACVCAQWPASAYLPAGAGHTQSVNFVCVRVCVSVREKECVCVLSQFVYVFVCCIGECICQLEWDTMCLCISVCVFVCVCKSACTRVCLCAEHDLWNTQTSFFGKCFVRKISQAKRIKDSAENLTRAAVAALTENQNPTANPIKIFLLQKYLMMFSFIVEHYYLVNLSKSMHHQELRTKLVFTPMFIL